MNPEDMNIPVKMVNGKPVFYPVMERKENGDLVAHMPSLSLISKLLEEKNGKHNLQ